MFELQILTIILISIAFVSVWSSLRIKGTPLWLAPFSLALALGLACNALSYLSLAWILLALLGFYSAQKWAQSARWMLVVLGIFVLAMGMNLLPGFNKIQLISPRLLGNSTHLFALEFRLAKPIAGLFVLAFIAQRCGSLKELMQSLLMLKHWVLPTLAVLAVGMLLGLAVDVKFFMWTPIFILSNLFFSVIPEEAFFRGFMQQPLHNRFGKALWIIPLMAILFALVHTPPAYMDPLTFYALIGLAGACYAWVYSIKQRIELAIAAHCLLNTLHFIFFTYPLAL